jgi:hypothetical protein
MKVLSFLITLSLLQLTTVRAADQEPSPGAALLDTGHTASTSADSTVGDLPADTTPDATLQLKGGSIAAEIGYVWGHGTVSYQGADYKFKINGVSVVDVGGAKISATGEVMRMGRLSDFAGTYVAWGANYLGCGRLSRLYEK